MIRYTYIISEIYHVSMNFLIDNIRRYFSIYKVFELSYHSVFYPTIKSQ